MALQTVFLLHDRENEQGLISKIAERSLYAFSSEKIAAQFKGDDDTIVVREHQLEEAIATARAYNFVTIRFDVPGKGYPPRECFILCLWEPPPI